MTRMALMTDSHGSHASHVDSHGSHGSLPRMLHTFQWRNLSYSTLLAYPLTFLLPLGRRAKEVFTTRVRMLLLIDIP